MGLNIVAIDIDDKKLESANVMKVLHYIYNANDLSFVQEVKELTNGGVHAVINTSVSTSSASLANVYFTSMLADKSIVGVPPKDENGKIEFPLSILGTISGELSCFRIGCWHLDKIQ
nr:zinc-binding dehydrogenase [Mycoplasmopsis bovis]